MINFAPAITNPSVVTGNTPRKNENHYNGVPLEVTGITPSWKNEVINFAPAVTTRSVTEMPLWKNVLHF